MTKDEAVFLLFLCKPLAAKFATRGINIQLDNEDLIGLRGFSRVWASGLLDDPYIHLLAGLKRSDIKGLTVKMAKECIVSRKNQLNNGKLENSGAASFWDVL